MSKIDSEFKIFEEKIKSLNPEKIKIEIVSLVEKIDFTEIINSQLEKIVNDKYFIPFNRSENRIPLYSTDEFELSLVHISPKNRPIIEGVLYSYISDMYFCPLIDVNDYKIDIYEQTFTMDSTLLNEDYSLILKESKKLKKHDVLFLRKFKDILKLDKQKPFLCFCYLSKKDVLDYSWEYNAQTLRPSRIASVNVNTERLNVISDMLSMIGNDQSVSALILLCNHSSHSVRWNAVNALINLDYDRGLKMVENMTMDSHVEVREAAKESLEFLKNSTENGN